MRFLSIAILAIVQILFCKVKTCKDFTCDSLAVRAVLNANGLDSSLPDSIEAWIDKYSEDSAWRKTQNCF